MQVELLKAYDPRFSISGRPASGSLTPEAAALQDGLLCHPALPGLDASVLAERRKDPNDLAAKVDACACVCICACMWCVCMCVVASSCIFSSCYFCYYSECWCLFGDDIAS